MNNPFANKAKKESTATPGYVQIMLSYLRSDKNGVIRGTTVTNGQTEYGTRFFVVAEMGGTYSIVGRVEQAQDIFFTTNDGERMDVSEMLIGKSLNVKLTEEEFEDLKDEAEDCEHGIGISAVFMVEAGRVNIRKLTYQTGEKVNSYTVEGELVAESVEECLSNLTSDSLSKEELLNYFDESNKKDTMEANAARAKNQAARQAAGNVANLRNTVINSADF